jgi:hypothetical protein
MNGYFNTPKGTELPLLDLRGKPYLQVAHRLVWFREEHPNWSIETEVSIMENKAAAVGSAKIKDETGRIIATAHKYEDQKGFQDFIEKSETGAVGRALAMCGYGTQFAPEIEEGERIVDSPTEAARQASAPKPSYGGVKKITEKQAGLFWAKARQAGWSNDVVKTYLRDTFDITETKDIPAASFNDVINFFGEQTKKNDEHKDGFGPL